MSNIYQELNLNNRDEVVAFLKSLICENPYPCPICDGKLDYFHKKAKRSNSAWICLECGKRYETIKILDQINEY